LRKFPNTLPALIFLSLNCRGLANPSNKLAIKWLVDLHQPSVLLLQEIIMEGEKAMLTLYSSLSGWDFFTVGETSHYGGIITGLHKDSLRLVNSWDQRLIMGVVLKLDLEFQVLNIYRPYSRERKLFWDNTL
jgi:exonuclease III